MSKIVLYQVFPRLFDNHNTTRKVSGTLRENGCGKFSSFSDEVLERIHRMGFTHIWYMGVIRHATTTDYSAYGIPNQHPEIVKGKAGSPYAIVDYYDVDPDLADNPDKRMEEWKALIKRTHRVGMKVIMDFVPNHVAREYHSICKPVGVRDLGEDDDTSKNFSQHNNFYYCWGQPLDLSQVLSTYPVDSSATPYIEIPAKATGNNCFTACPSEKDWYETIKLNYGIDYCNPAGRSTHFNPIPDTWEKMTRILLFWANTGIDGFRCDMAEMVPDSFWSYTTKIVKNRYPQLIFIGEVYDPNRYHTYLAAGFDYLYDKVGMYDTMRAIIRNERPASDITVQWQNRNDIQENMLYFLENHDEQRIASDFFCGDSEKAVPAVIVGALLQRNPFMVYCGQEFGEKGMDEEGYSSRDGRTTIFDYWSPSTLTHAYESHCDLTAQFKQLSISYCNIFHTATHEKSISDGDMFDLMYMNPTSDHFDSRRQFAFLRKYKDEVLFIVVNFSSNRVNISVKIPGHAFDYLHLPQKRVTATDLLSGDIYVMNLSRDKDYPMMIEPYNGRVYKFNLKMDDRGFALNEHHKDEFPPAHTAEHLLNQLMMRKFGCERSDNAHIERRKSKISYIIDHEPSRKEVREIEDEMNRLIQADMMVSYEFVDRDHIPAEVKLDRLPKEAHEMIRLVRIDNYDVCPCLGKHVRSTSQIGRFVLLGTNWDAMKHSFRIRFKVTP
ncbi:MAG: alpha-amylase family glycosyl hydrolase [Prevotella sp.]